MAGSETVLAESAPRSGIFRIPLVAFDLRCLAAEFVPSWDWHSDGLSRLRDERFSALKTTPGTAIAQFEMLFTNETKLLRR
jgi:hypothetical protein